MDNTYRDIHGQAIWDFYHQEEKGKLWVENEMEAQEMPIDVYFRGEIELPELERKALELCRGKVIDLGAGAGSHSLLLQSKNIDVTALEISSLACDTMRERGVENVIEADLFDYSFEHRYDTILMMMNGVGLVGYLNKLSDFLFFLKGLLAPNGQIVLDSSDITHLYEGELYNPNDYYGETTFRYKYDNKRGNWFNWLYVDSENLTECAEQAGFTTEILHTDPNNQYLAKLSLI